MDAAEEQDLLARARQAARRVMAEAQGQIPATPPEGQALLNAVAESARRVIAATQSPSGRKES
ncbi:MAG TPA: hypothetical protein VL992_04200 [Tepidisphaeraceae bacterium]|nr:hypothetical protein [Tepidisphaeraceae bacterium]